MKIKTLIIIGIVVMGFIIFSITQLSGNKQTPNSIQEIIDDCQGLEVEETAKCLSVNVKTFFIYNKTNYPQNFGEIKTHGGLCNDWSKFYVNLSQSLGYESEIITTKEETHAFAIISDGLKGCILDMKKVSCSNNISELVEDFIENYVEDPNHWTAEDLRNNTAYREALAQETKDLQGGIN